ncbi:MAG: GNAT family N-acetyltransferase [Candidatus Diapherotrites archaeon]
MQFSIKQDNEDYINLKRLAEATLNNYKLPLRKIKKYSKNNDFTLLFALKKNKKIGFIAGFGKNCKMHIWLFGVSKNERGKGIGKALLKRFHSIARRKGYLYVDTLTFNKYSYKLLLSIKLGYIIYKTKYLKDKKDLGIFLEKRLT